MRLSLEEFKKEMPNSTFYVAENIDFVLGKGNPAVHHKSYLTFGSLFSYYDFAIPTYDSKMDLLRYG